MRRFLLFIFIFFTGIIKVGANQAIPQRPNPPRLVNDFAGILSESQKRYLELKLVAFGDSTGTQIAVVTVNDLGGYDRAEFTYTLLTEWGVGQAGKNNGVVIMVKPTGGQGERHAFIAPGYGLEGIIPDITAKRIVENEMIPKFRQGNFFEGIDNATDVIMGLAVQEFTAAEYERGGKVNPIVSLLPLLFFFLMFLLMTKARHRNASIGHGMSWWTLLMLMNAGNRRHSGSWGNFSGGGGGFGGGGFGGFGGGRSGGGGAGGSW